MAVSREQLIFDAFANTSRAEAGFVALGRKAGAASDDVSALAKRLDEVSAKSAQARVDVNDADALAKLDKLDFKTEQLAHRVIDVPVTVEGAARAALEIEALDKELDTLSSRAGDAQKATSGLAGTGGAGAGGLAGGGMGALIAAGVALSPVIATVGTGLGGLGVAAYGIAKPIENAAQKTGGLAANMARLNPEQQAVAQGILGLGREFAGFQKQIQPEVFGIFNQGLRLAGTLLHDVEPVAEATGKAFGGFLGQVDATFQSGTWQGFFAFMQRTAAPDMQLLAANFTSLMMALPPLVEQLQPVATDLLKITNAGLQLTGWLAKSNQSLDATGQHMSGLQHVTADLRTVLFSPGAGLAAALKLLHITGGDAGQGLSTAAAAAAVAGPKFFSLDKTVKDLNTDMGKLVGNLLTLQGSELSWKQALQAAQTQLKSNTAGLEGNSKNALANRQAVLQSTNAALQFASQQLTLGKNIDGADQTVQRQISWLQGLHDKSKFVRDEIHALRQEEQLLAQQRIDQTIHVQGLGQWQVSQSLAPGAGHRRALGGLIPGSGSGDTYPALLTPGELVVPKGMVSAGAVDHLRGRLPGFASGGLVPTYSGGVGGMTPWVKGNDAATIRLIDEAVVRATVAGMRAAQSAASGFGTPGPGGGAPAANAALARRMMTDWASGANWAAWNYVAMRESGWNQFARNPSSGAYGIPQALPPGKMGPAANPPQSNPAAQISWMIGYMQSRYGGPIGAANHERQFGWYDRGGWLHPGVTMAVNSTGQSERVVSPAADKALAAALNRLAAALEDAPERTGAAVGAVINGTARGALYSGRYSSR